MVSTGAGADEMPSPAVETMQIQIQTARSQNARIREHIRKILQKLSERQPSKTS